MTQEKKQMFPSGVFVLSKTGRIAEVTLHESAGSACKLVAFRGYGVGPESEQAGYIASHGGAVRVRRDDAPRLVREIARVLGVVATDAFPPAPKSDDELAADIAREHPRLSGEGLFCAIVRAAGGSEDEALQAIRSMAGLGGAARVGFPSQGWFAPEGVRYDVAIKRGLEAVRAALAQRVVDAERAKTAAAAKEAQEKAAAAEAEKKRAAHAALAANQPEPPNALEMKGLRRIVAAGRVRGQMCATQERDPVQRAWANAACHGPGFVLRGDTWVRCGKHGGQGFASQFEVVACANVPGWQPGDPTDSPERRLTAEEVRAGYNKDVKRGTFTECVVRNMGLDPLRAAQAYARWLPANDKHRRNLAWREEEGLGGAPWVSLKECACFAAGYNGDRDKLPCELEGAPAEPPPAAPPPAPAPKAKRKFRLDAGLAAGIEKAYKSADAGHIERCTVVVRECWIELVRCEGAPALYAAVSEAFLGPWEGAGLRVMRALKRKGLLYKDAYTYVDLHRPRVLPWHA